MIDKGIVLKHLEGVLEEKTKQYADHLINRATLQKKIEDHVKFSDEDVESFEKDLKFMAGRKELKNQKYMSELTDRYKENLTKYVQQKSNVSNLEYAEKAMEEHEKFLTVVQSLKSNFKK